MTRILQTHTHTHTGKHPLYFIVISEHWQASGDPAETEAHKENSVPPAMHDLRGVCTCTQTDRDIASVCTRLDFCTSFVSCFCTDCFHIANRLAMQQGMRELGILGFASLPSSHVCNRCEWMSEWRAWWLISHFLWLFWLYIQLNLFLSHPSELKVKWLSSVRLEKHIILQIYEGF